MNKVKRFFEAVCVGAMAIIAAFFVILLACFNYVFKTEKEPIKYSRNGKVVDLNDFRADKAGREL